MHTHTTVSDGKMTPEEIKQTYVNAGYSIVAFTDHEVIANHGHLSDDRFLAITAYEYAVNEICEGIPREFLKTYHLNLFSKVPQKTDYRVFSVDHANLFEKGRQYIPKQMEERRYPSSYSTASVNELIRIANEEGFLVSLNHPTWSLQDHEDYADLHGLWGVELYNTACVNMGYTDTPVPLDTLLRKGEKPFPLATDDAHSIGDCHGGWLMVSAEKLEYTAVMSALEKGNFYASTGPEIKEISFEDGKLTVRTSEAVGISVSTDRRASYFKRSKDGALIGEAVFDLSRYVNNCALRNTPHYVRVTVRDREGRQAWSRAYFLDELN
ncbi:MAG: PHP domain-containing protein [Ruminococcaceae bacterium]|nr:PHP domain-containing protein [Oscillospiraceae bacterium]